MPGESTIIAQWGAWGVIVLGQAYVVVHLWKQLKESQKQLTEEHKARLDDAKENTAAMLELAERSTEAIHSLHTLVEAVKSLMRKVKGSEPPSSS